MQIPPIFDTYVGDFISSGKKTEMLLFLPNGQRKRKLIASSRKCMMEQKVIPNGSMLLYVSMGEILNASTEFMNKI